jgi:hypothetical protein
MVEDEGYSQLHGTICKMWVAPENLTPVLYHNPVRKGAKYFGAVRIRHGNCLPAGIGQIQWENLL